LYFKNKDDLLISLFEDRMEWAIERLKVELSSVEEEHPGDALEKLHAYVQLHCTLAAEDRNLAEFLTVELRQSAKFVKEYNNPKFGDYLRILQGIIEDGQQRGQLREGLDSKLMSRAIFGALDEVLLQLTLSRTPPRDVKQKASQIAALFIEGMREERRA
jgi:TetR/AcrR family fatty acid metabolism transcriptional regulator